MEKQSLFTDILEELKLVFLGKSMDILVPPILFIVLYRFFDIWIALIGALVLNSIIFLVRIRKQDNWYYTFGGFIGILGSVLVTYLSDNASNYFLADLIGTSLLVFITIGSLVLKKPLAAWVSHITRGWDINWFFRKDVLPAYTEVTWFWLTFFLVRGFIEMYLYQTSSVEVLSIANIILGYPVMIVVLIISYVYGITRLHHLGGPGVDEFMKKHEPPYRGQTRGF